jgi:hypothetical protein
MPMRYGWINNFSNKRATAIDNMDEPLDTMLSERRQI